MLYLKKVNEQDAQEEYNFITELPADENGFTNKYYGISREEFMQKALPEIVNFSEGIGLPEGYVPETDFFLWDDNHIAGLFRVRHYLNDFLKKGAGHIGYGIKKEDRGKGYASHGLAMALEEARELVKEDEIYMSVNRDNPASLRVQEKNGAYIHHMDDKEYYTRIKLQPGMQ
nr:GNAT family N-acetyltransferase [uncultured Eisenbergiella sp.]